MHVNEHAPEEAFHPCNICGETFLSASEMSHHMEVHTTSDKPSTKKLVHIRSLCYVLVHYDYIFFYLTFNYD